MSLLLLVLLALAAFRIQRLVTEDEWPPSEWFRDWVARRTGTGSSWTTLVTCPWCLGAWVSLALVAVVHYAVVPLRPNWLLWWAAVAAGVGLLASWSE